MAGAVGRTLIWPCYSPSPDQTHISCYLTRKIPLLVSIGSRRFFSECRMFSSASCDEDQIGPFPMLTLLFNTAYPSSQGNALISQSFLVNKRLDWPHKTSELVDLRQALIHLNERKISNYVSMCSFQSIHNFTVQPQVLVSSMTSYSHSFSLLLFKARFYEFRRKCLQLYEFWAVRSQRETWAVLFLVVKKANH